MLTSDFSRALTLLEEGNAGEAAAILTRIVTRFPRYAAAQAALATAIEIHGTADEALHRWSIVERLAPGSKAATAGVASATRAIFLPKTDGPAPTLEQEDQDSPEEVVQRQEVATASEESAPPQDVDTAVGENVPPRIGGTVIEEGAQWEEAGAASEESAEEKEIGVTSRGDDTFSLVSPLEAPPFVDAGALVLPPTESEAVDENLGAEWEDGSLEEKLAAGEETPHTVGQPWTPDDAELLSHIPIAAVPPDDDASDDPEWHEVPSPAAEPEGAVDESPAWDSSAAETGDGSSLDVDVNIESAKEDVDLDKLIDELEAARIVPRPDLDAIPEPDLSNDIEDVVSETLARIYATQKQYGEAARVYERLALENPDRAGEFEDKAAEMRGHL